jgi:uncharacterized protein YndB with AHSA1/START domain
MDGESKQRSLTFTFSVPEAPQQVFEAITNVRAWWSGDIVGPTDVLGGEFSYRYEDLHSSRQRVTELVPGKRVAWLVLDSRLSFLSKEKNAWDGTKITFDVARQGDATVVRFTHEGLVPECECYGACSAGWKTYIPGSLRKLITTGKGKPNPVALGGRS